MILNLRLIKQKHGEKLKDNSIVLSYYRVAKQLKKMLENLEDRTKKGSLRKK
jgi:hypothetical protein